MRKAKLFLMTIIMIVSYALDAQVAINTDGTAPDASAMLDVKSTDKGMLIPRMTSTQRNAITSLSDGLLLYDTDTKSFWFYNNSAWSELINDNNHNELADGDNDTKVEVDKNLLDSDVIRFTTDGTEYFAMAQGRLGIKNTGGSVFVGSNVSVLDDLSNNNNIAIGNWTSHLTTTGEKNIALGFLTFYKNQTGNSNIAIGANALYENTERSDLIAIGDSALYNNGTGAFNNLQSIENIAIGSKSLLSNTTGSENTALGFQTLYTNSYGYANTAIGNKALRANTHGNRNTAVGANSLSVGSTGAQNTAIGAFALQKNTSNFNTAVGSSSLLNNASGTSNTAVGCGSLANNIDGDGNTVVGSNALYSNTGGDGNIAIGKNALYRNTTGSSNIAIGRRSLYHSQTANGLVAVGDSALFDNGISGGGIANTAIGDKSLRSNRSGYHNTATGSGTLYSNVSGNNNTASGYLALHDNTDYDNSAFGSYALSENTSGTDNTAMGSEAMVLNTTGDNNTAIGRFALGSNSDGNENTVIGSRALTSGSGDGNVAVGFKALENTTSHYNTAIGYKAGDNITGGARNIVIGYNIDAPSATGNSRMSIGNLIFGTGVNGTGTTYSTGNIGIGINNPSQKLDVRGNIQAKKTSGSARIYIDGTAGNNELQFRESGSYAAAVGYNTVDNYLYLYQGGNVVLRGGNMGVGTTNPGYRLQVGNSGDGSTARANAWNTFSDKNLKKDFEIIPRPMEKLKQISGYYYYWKNGSDNSRQVGVIAQEIEKVLPEIVSTDAEGIKSLDYSKIVPLLIEAVKQQQQTIEELSKKIAK